MWSLQKISWQASHLIGRKSVMSSKISKNQVHVRLYRMNKQNISICPRQSCPTSNPAFEIISPIMWKSVAGNKNATKIHCIQIQNLNTHLNACRSFQSNARLNLEIPSLKHLESKHWKFQPKRGKKILHCLKHKWRSPDGVDTETDELTPWHNFYCVINSQVIITVN